MTRLTNAERQARWRERQREKGILPKRGVTKRQPWDARTREKIKVGRLIDSLMKCADGKMEISITRLRAIEILLRKVVPDLRRTIVQADVNIEYVVRLPDVLSKEDWLKRYGDPTKQIEGIAGPGTLQ